MNISNSITPNYTYSSQGQEKQRETGWSSYRWRNYDASFARFFTVDPLAEKMPSWSPYSYAFDNPIRYTDPDGREPKDDYRLGKNGHLQLIKKNK